MLGSFDPKGVAYIETKNLDGETNLKHKVVPKEIRSLYPNEEEVYFHAKITKKVKNANFKFLYEKPNPYLYNFTGKLISNKIIKGTVIANGKKLPCDNSNFVLRGCSLRNTEWIYGVVAYSGYIFICEL